MKSSATPQGILCQFGCGLCAPPDWTNFDNSPRLWLAQLPIVGALVPAGPYGSFPDSVRYGDVVKGLPLSPNSVRLMCSSHVLEHLALEDLRTALRNCFSLIQPGGIFRSVLPDLERLIREYTTNETDLAAERFIVNSGMGKRTRPRGANGFLRSWLGNSSHFWLWDYKGLKKELEAAGFTAVRRAEFGDSGIAEFAAVESADRWKNSLGFQCSK